MRTSKADRYVAFVATYLPRLMAVTGVSYDKETSWRGLPLICAAERAAELPGLFLEFGVYQGNSINYCAEKFPDRRFFGFDSFEGFPDDGRSDWQGDFSTQGTLPKVRDNVTLIKGYFSTTLPRFLASNKEPIAFINVDCDIYSSTKDVFDNLNDSGILRPGLPISFDELINYDSYLWNEMLALFEVLEETGLGIQWISAHQRVRTIDETIFLLKSNTFPTWAADLANGYRQQASLVLTSESLDLSVLSDPRVYRRIRQMADDFVQLTEKRHPTMLDRVKG